ncbi:MAG: MerR family transcriptional regulator [Eubacterium sp.]
MKIKEVCEKTKLTDKTIRYYIRCGLIFPKYNENYTGRKNFDFDDKDIERLNQVAILRKYNFSINSIKTILENSDCIDTVIKEHIADMREKTEISFKLLSRLDNVSNCEFSNIDELCDKLCQTEYLPESVPSADNKKPYKLLYLKNKRINKALVALVIIVFILSAVLFSLIFNNIRCITDSSIIDINNGFVGIRVIEAEDKNDGIQYNSDLYIEDDCFTDISDKFDEFSATVDKSLIGRDTIIIHAVIHSDKAMVKIVPIYESRYTDEPIYYNSSCWLGLEGTSNVTAESNFVMKSRNYKYQYKIEIISEK